MAKTANTAERSIEGRRIVITGATNGIGKEIARGLARRGADLTLIARNPQKAKDTAAELLELGAPGVDIVEADLSSLQSVREAVISLHSRLDHIDVLVNNAGITAFDSQQATVDGFDRQIAVNYLAPFLLTVSTLDLLRGGWAPRIVSTASEAHRHASKPNPETLAMPQHYGMFGGQLIYGQSKLLNILFTKELARHVAGSGITANCFCPGAVSTGLVRDNSRVSAVWRAAGRAHLLRTPEQGARMGLRLILDPALEGVSGEFFTSTPGLRLLSPVRSLSDFDLQHRIWQRSVELVGL